MTNFTRPLVDLLVAEADARRRATERGDDPETCPEVVGTGAVLKAQLGVQQQLAQRVNGPRREGYDPLRGLQHTRVIGP